LSRCSRTQLAMPIVARPLRFAQRSCSATRHNLCHEEMCDKIIACGDEPCSQPRFVAAGDATDILSRGRMPPPGAIPAPSKCTLEREAVPSCWACLTHGMSNGADIEPCRSAHVLTRTRAWQHAICAAVTEGIGKEDQTRKARRRTCNRCPSGEVAQNADHGASARRAVVARPCAIRAIAQER
jgi:hypothetical protein